MKIALNKKLITVFFLLIELVLCILVQLIGGAWLSFFAIALAFLYVLLNRGRALSYYFSLLALFFTVLADICLVLLSPRQQLFGMIFFFITQLFYFALILSLEREERVNRVHSVVRIVSLGIISVVTALTLGEKIDALSLISMLYYTNLVVSVVFAFILTRGGGKATRFLLPIGLLFFAICDLFVGFGEIAPYFTVTEGTLAHFLANPPFNIAWLFYIPSQTILAVNSIINKKS